MSFLRRTRAKTLSSVEDVALSKLQQMHSDLISTDDGWDFQSPEGSAACAVFLQEIDAASQALRLEPVSRDYRENFTVNYQVLFPTDDRQYRNDILVACSEQYSGIWLNGERYDFSTEVKDAAMSLMQAWTELSTILAAWKKEDNKKDKGEFKTALRAFDQSWARFEHRYIMNLIHVEQEAKKLITDSVDQEGILQKLEAIGMDCDCTEYRDERTKFVQCISKLNAVANTERKGRTDLSDEILDNALKLWRSCGGAERPLVKTPESVPFGKTHSTASTSSRSSSSPTDVKKQFIGILRLATKTMHKSSKVVSFEPEEDVSDFQMPIQDFSGKEAPEISSVAVERTEMQDVAGDLSAARCLAGDVVESYWHLRYYLRDIANSVERVDPNLSANAKLVSRLEDWEESWEVGRDYVNDVEMFKAVCDLVCFLKEAEKLEPVLAEMTQECGAEFCLCLPRLVWLHFLHDPERNLKLLQKFLPHRFTSTDCSSSPSGQSWDNTIEELLCRYQVAQRGLNAHLDTDSECNTQRFLVQSVIEGPNSESQSDLSTQLSLHTKSHCDTLVHAIEEFSIELQRHRPEDWNHFMMLIVRCFSHGKPKQRERMGPQAPVSKVPSSRSRSIWRRRPRLRTMPFPAITCPGRNAR